MPSKRAELNARLLEIVTPRFDEFVQELMRIALEGKREGDRLKAIAELFDRALGKSPEILEVCDEDLPVIDELLARWRESKPE
ncbi:MAG: hypothetical protein IPP13_21605 [Kouleothrix sp.]|nr:hypothetical protein [Kouleothrix sp.]